jgi:hypothetical protein
LAKKRATARTGSTKKTVAETRPTFEDLVRHVGPLPVTGLASAESPAGVRARIGGKLRQG